MKIRNLLFTLLFLLVAGYANSQIIYEGDKMINLGLGIGNNIYSGMAYHTTTPPVSASFEVILNDEMFDDRNAALGIGGYVGYFGYKYKYSSVYNWRYSNFVIGPRGYMHYHFMDYLDTYAGLMLGYRLTSYTGGASVLDYTPDSSGLAYSLFIGARFYLNDYVAVMGELGYGISYLNLGATFKF